MYMLILSCCSYMTEDSSPSIIKSFSSWQLYIIIQETGFLWKVCWTKWSGKKYTAVVFLFFILLSFFFQKLFFFFFFFFYLLLKYLKIQCQNFFWLSLNKRLFTRNWLSQLFIVNMMQNWRHFLDSFSTFSWITIGDQTILAKLWSLFKENQKSDFFFFT